MILFSKLRDLGRKIKKNSLLSFLVFLLIVAFVTFVGVLFFDCVENCISGLIGLTAKNKILTFLGIGMGGILVALQAQMSYKRSKAMEDTAEAQAKATKEQARANKNTEQGLRQERLKNAIEHLGHDSSSVRLGGAYELFHLAEDNKDLRKTAFDMLCLYIRQTTRENEYQEKHKSKPSEEVQSLLTLLFVQDHEVFKDLQINLQGSWLNGADLYRARLEKAILAKAHLQGATLAKARLQEANLAQVCLRETNLVQAQLQGAYLIKACLQGTYLIGTRMQMTVLDRACLQGAYISGTYLQGTSLYGAHLQGANISEIGLQGASLYEAHLQGTGSKNGPLGTPFADRIRGSIDQNKSIGDERDMYEVVFEGGLSREDVDAFVEGLSDEKAEQLQRVLEPHIGESKSYRLPTNSYAITGAYTGEEAKKWIAEYEEAMSKVPEDDS